MSDFGILAAWSGICFTVGVGVHFTVVRVLRHGSLDMEAVQRAQIDRLTRVVEKYREQTAHQRASIAMHEEANADLQAIVGQYKAACDAAVEECDRLRTLGTAPRGSVEKAVRDYVQKAASVGLSVDDIAISEMARTLPFKRLTVRRVFQKIRRENAHVA